MNIGGHTIGVCSWSLHPQDTADLVAQVKQAGLSHVQLGLAGLSVLDDKRKLHELDHLSAAGISITGGMVGFQGEDYSSIANIRRTGGFVPDQDWPARKAITQQAAALARDLGLPHISAHIGFVPPRGEATYQTVRDRIREIADLFADHRLSLLMETGQEKAEELLEFLHDLQRDNVFINFDPANMILYGAGEPIPAIRTLGNFIRHVHVKDATASAQPGEAWGEEVPFGAGQVGAARFLQALHEVGYTGPLCIEREAGNQRLTDVKAAVAALKQAAQ
jgi:L-ribulose-5-phosphate 3-epimerase